MSNHFWIRRMALCSIMQTETILVAIPQGLVRAQSQGL